MRYLSRRNSIEHERSGIRFAVLALMGCLGLSPAAFGDPVAFTVSYGDLLAIDVETGATNVIGPAGLNSAPALTLSPGGVLYGVSWLEGGWQLVVFDQQSGAATVVGPLGVDDRPTGLSFDPRARLWMTVADALYLVDSGTGAATLWAPMDRGVMSLSVRWKRMYVFTFDDEQGRWLEQLDPETGELTPLWSLDHLQYFRVTGSSFASDGTLWFMGGGNFLCECVELGIFKMPDLSTGVMFQTSYEIYSFNDREAGIASMALPQWPKLLSARR